MGRQDAEVVWRPHVENLELQLAATREELQRANNARDLLMAKSNAFTRALALVPAEVRPAVIEAFKRELATTYVRQLVEVGCAPQTAHEWAAYEASVLDTLYPETKVAASKTPPQFAHFPSS
jgi:hypothetical protein